MSPRYPVPAFFIDEIKLVEATGNGRALIELDSLGTPIRLSLSMHDMVKLGHMARATASEMFAGQRNNVVEFSKPKRARKRKSAEV
jgi:hypothetical protein